MGKPKILAIGEDWSPLLIMTMKRLFSVQAESPGRDLALLHHVAIVINDNETSIFFI